MSFPNLPGVPPLQSASATALASVALVASPLISNLLDKLKPKWEIQDAAGKKVIDPDAFLSIDYHNESNIPMFPIESGAFDSYNKIATPYIIAVKIAKGAKIDMGFNSPDLKTFLNTLESIQGDTKNYSIITPDATYLNATLKGFDYKRETNNGASMIIATLNFVQVMKAQIAVSNIDYRTLAPDPVNSPLGCQKEISLGMVHSEDYTTLTGRGV